MLLFLHLGNCWPLRPFSKMRIIRVLQRRARRNYSFKSYRYIYLGRNAYFNTWHLISLSM